MLFGEHAVIYQKPCIVTAVNQRLFTRISLSRESYISISAPDIKIVNKRVKSKTFYNLEKYPKGIRFILGAINNFQKDTGRVGSLDVVTKSDFSSKFGFGSSSAVTVCVLFALSKLYGENYSKNKLFDLSYKTVLDVQGVGSGFDLAAAIFGGNIYFLTGGKKIERINKRKLPLVVGYTGIKADTTKLVGKVAKLYKRNKNEVKEIFNLITLVTEKARYCIENCKYRRLGELMNINQGLLESLGVNTIELNNLIYAARSAGAYGAKLSGAGGGDCMIALSSGVNRERIERLIKKRGGWSINAETGAEGVRVE